ncbi:MAG: SHOCT domain-containing protein [Planctomycetes bacterium]|nr:SHOCT domain-containing protein [Planctomycetota bacterium]
MFFASGFADVIPAILVLVIVAIVGCVVLLSLRRNVKNPPLPPIPFTLGDLKKLLDDGSITNEEYEKAKQAIIDLVKKSTTDSLEKDF